MKIYNNEPMTKEQIERCKEYFSKLPIVAVPSENAEVTKCLNEIARELKAIRKQIERRR